MINLVELNTYCQGVLPAEVFTSWPQEALAAFAVTVNSFSIGGLNKRFSVYGCDFIASSTDQNYFGRDVTDFRDEIDKDGFKLTLDLRRGTDPDALMLRLFKETPLEDSFPCNFNILIDSVPRQMGIPEIISEWIRFRSACLRREFAFDLARKKEKLHLLVGLGKILLDIDKAIKIIRSTEKRAEPADSISTRQIPQSD